MNIVIINDYASVQGGAAQVAVKSALGLANAGFNITFIFAAGMSDTLLQHDKIRLVCLEQYDLLNNPSPVKAALNGIWNYGVEKKLDQILSTFNKTKTIVHVHSWVKSLSISAISSVLRSGIPNVLTLHDYFTVCPNGGFYNYQQQAICTYDPLSSACVKSNCDSRSYSYKLWRVFRQLFYRRAQFVNNWFNYITVSDFSESILRPYLPATSSFFRVRNPIDIVKRTPVKPSNSKNYTFIGRLSKEKGVLLLTNLKSIPQENLQFVGSGELEAHLKSALPKAKFFGWLNADELINVLEDTRVLLFTSQLFETQGLVVAEAAARGVPSLVSDATAAKEFIAHNKTGLLFKSGCVESLDFQIKILKDDMLVDSLGLAAFEDYWQDAPTLESHINCLLNCYKNILENF